MVTPLFAAAASGLGSLFSGYAQSKAAKGQQKTAIGLAVDYVNATAQDQQRAIDYAREDEARLKAASGYDLTKLVADARAAGFNPLTVLQATGGAGYDGRGAVLTTPFISIGDAFLNRANLVLGTGAAIVNSAGYIGEAISAGGSAYVAQANQDKAFQQAQQQIDLEAARITGQSPFGGGGAVQSVGYSPKVSHDSPFNQVRGPTGDLVAPPVDVFNKYVYVYDDESDRFIKYLNPDLTDAGPTEIATGIATIGAAEGAQYGDVTGVGSLYSPPQLQGLKQSEWVSFKAPSAGKGNVTRIVIWPEDRR